MAPQSDILSAEKAEELRIEDPSTEKGVLQTSSPSGLDTVENGAEEDVDVSSYSKEEASRILRKVDFRLVPTLAILYLLAFIDRSNIANAKIAGMKDDLNLRGMQYNVALVLFFVPYTVFEVPSNIVLKLVRPSVWMSILLFSWGTVMTLMGIVQNYHGLLACRFFLGFTEAGFFPAATYLLTIWYQRYEVQRRMAVFYAAASLSGAFSGLLAFAIENMDGVGNLAGWRWIFILEGLLPILASSATFYLLPDNPQRARFLTESEKKFIIARLATDSGSGQGKVTNNDKLQMKFIVAAFKEWKIWAAIVMFLANTVGVYGFTATVPTVIADMGYSSADAQLLTIPVYFVAMLVCLIFAFLSDKYQQRIPFIIGGYIIAVLGFIAQLAIPQPRLPGLTYAMLFLVAIGLYAPFTSIVTLTGNNLAPSSKRAVGMALLISVGNMGGIPGSLAYFEADKPQYPTGFGLSLAMCVMGILAAIVLRIAYKRVNKRREQMVAEQGEEVVRSKYGEEELLELGDKSPFFRYTL